MSSLYLDTSVLVAAFSVETAQSVAQTLLQDEKWRSIFVSDWTLTEFVCAFHAKVLRGETPQDTFTAIQATLKRLVAQEQLTVLAVLREDYLTVQKKAPALTEMIRGADALHLAIAARMKTTHFASFDKAQQRVAKRWLKKTHILGLD